MNPESLPCSNEIRPRSKPLRTGPRSFISGRLQFTTFFTCSFQLHWSPELVQATWPGRKHIPGITRDEREKKTQKTLLFSRKGTRNKKPMQPECQPSEGDLTAPLFHNLLPLEKGATTRLSDAGSSVHGDLHPPPHQQPPVLLSLLYPCKASQGFYSHIATCWIFGC